MLTSANEIWWNRPKQVSGANQNIFRSYGFFGIWTFVMKFLENSSIEILWIKTINQIVAWGERGAHKRAHLHTLTNYFKRFQLSLIPFFVYLVLLWKILKKCKIWVIKVQIRKKTQDLKMFWLVPETCFGLFYQISFEEVNIFTKSRFHTALLCVRCVERNFGEFGDSKVTCTTVQIIPLCPTN